MAHKLSGLYKFLLTGQPRKQRLCQFSDVPGILSVRDQEFCEWMVAQLIKHYVRLMFWRLFNLRVQNRVKNFFFRRVSFNHPIGLRNIRTKLFKTAGQTGTRWAQLLPLCKAHTRFGDQRSLLKLFAKDGFGEVQHFFATVTTAQCGRRGHWCDHAQWTLSIFCSDYSSATIRWFWPVG